VTPDPHLERVVRALVAALREVREVLARSPVLDEAPGGAMPVPAVVPAVRWAGDRYVELVELMVRTNISFSQLAGVFEVSAQGELAPRVTALALRGLSEADARRYICALVLMVRQLVTIHGASFTGAPLAQLQAACRARGVPDNSRNLGKETRAEGWI
jgi:hypothetical protein